MITSRPFSFTLTLCLVPAGLSIIGCAPSSQHRPDTASLRILHWNDFHVHNTPYDVSDSSDGAKRTYKVGGSGNLLGYLKHLGKNTEGVATFNAGDDFQGNPISGLTNGMSQVELMNIIQPDAMVPGNHEFDYGLASLRNAISKSTFTIVAANLYDSSTGTTLLPPTAVKTFGTVKVGIIGVLPPDLGILTMKQTLLGTRMLALDSVVAFHAARLRHEEHVDLVVVLSHMGLAADTLLAMRHPSVDIIVGGHSHTALFKPKKKHRTIVVQAGSWGRYVGKLDLVVDLQGDSVLSYSGELVETKLGGVPVDSVAERKAASLEALVDKELNQEIGMLSVEWRRSFNSESNVGNWAADVLREFAGTDIAFVNSGTIRKNMSPGIITKLDMWQMFPFGNSFVSFSVSGDTLMNMIEWQAARKGEFMQASGLHYTFDPDKPEGRKVVAARVHGTAIERKRMYTVATNNYVGGHLPELLGVQQSSVIQTELDGIDRDVYIQAIQRMKTVTSTLEGRVINAKTSSPHYDKIN